MLPDLITPIWYPEGAKNAEPGVNRSPHLATEIFTGLFSWFAMEVARTGLRLRARFHRGFAAGYVNGMLAAGAGALVLMLFLDWILPFVYNVGFSGFQASVLVWLFMGGLLALEGMVD